MKLYADEAEHELIRGLDGPIVISELARVEVASAIWRKHRTGELELDDALLLVRAFDVDYAGSSRAPRFIALSVTGEILELGARLVGRHSLRAYDAVQLASALTARTVSEDCDTIAAFDRGLMRAAVAEGLQVLV